MESIILTNANRFYVFYSVKTDRQLTALASAYNREIRTERVVVVDGNRTKPSAHPLIKVTILN